MGRPRGRGVGATTSDRATAIGRALHPPKPRCQCKGSGRSVRGAGAGRPEILARLLYLRIVVAEMHVVEPSILAFRDGALDGRVVEVERQDDVGRRVAGKARGVDRWSGGHAEEGVAVEVDGVELLDEVAAGRRGIEIGTELRGAG